MTMAIQLALTFFLLIEPGQLPAIEQRWGIDISGPAQVNQTLGARQYHRLFSTRERRESGLELFLTHVRRFDEPAATQCRRFQKDTSLVPHAACQSRHQH